MAAKFSPGRCNYCQAPAVASMSRVFWFSRQGSRRTGTVYYRTCAEHEGCDNWEGCRAINPDMTVYREDAR